MRFKRLNLLFSFLVICIHGFTQDTLTINTEIITVKDGLSQGLISCILQDKEGLMWFGTKDGLNKYDGYHFTVYHHEPNNPNSLPDNYISGIVEDENGNFWVGTHSSGLCLFDKQNEKFYRVKLHEKNGSVSNNSVYPLKSHNGQLMVRNIKIKIYDIRDIHKGNYENVVLGDSRICFDEDQLTQLNTNLNSGIAIQNWTSNLALHFSCADSVFEYSAIKSGKYIYNKSYLNYWPRILDKSQYYYCDTLNSRQLIFVGKKDIVVFDSSNSTVLKRINFLYPYFYNNNIQKDRLGNYFIFRDENLYFLNIKDYTLIPVKGKLGNGGYYDRNGILWMGTSGDGIIKYDYRKQFFKPVKRRTLWAFVNNPDGNFLSFENGLPAVVNPYTKAVKILIPSNHWKSNWILKEFIAEKNGRVWMSIFDALDSTTYLISYDKASDNLNKLALKSYYTGNPIKLILDKNENLWIGIFDKNKTPLLLKINKYTLEINGEYVFPAMSHFDFAYFISAYYQDKNGILWFSTLQGLYSFDEQQKKWNHWKHQKEDKTSLNYDQLLTILPDPKFPEKFLWVGSDGGGLSRFEIAKGGFINYGTEHGLPNNVVYGLLNDTKGNLWMSTNRGLSCFNTSKNFFRNFSGADGLQGEEFNRHEYYKLPNGDLLFGGVFGGVIFNPEEVLKEEKSAEIILTGLSVFNKTVSYKTDPKIIEMPINFAQSITLSNDQKMFTLSFAALDFQGISKKHYKYFLEGFDKEWIDSKDKNEATYTNLEPGSYLFHVTAKESNGDWNKNEATLRVKILPAWYQTWWFKITIALSIIGALYGLYRYRLKQQLNLFAIRNRIAGDLHDEIGSTLSSISLSSTIIQKKLGGELPEVSKLMDQISMNSDNMMEAMSDIVWTINTQNDRFDNIINRMRAFAIEILEPKNCLVHFTTSKNLENITLDMGQRKNLYLLFKEIINNAAKYSECKNVWVDISLSNFKKVILKVRDDGKGFSVADTEINKIGSLGGNGLSNMRKRTLDLNGEIYIVSELGKGTEITITFLR